MPRPRTVKRGAPVTERWTYRWRKIHRVRRLVKVRRIPSREQIRLAA